MLHPEPALLSVADGVARGLGLKPHRFEADELIEQAEHRARRRFRTRDFEPALRVLLTSCDGEAELSVFGRISLQWDALRLLRHALRLEEAEEEAPELLRAPIEAPIFITGLPRSGTTFLQMLLAQDEDNVTPLTWQTMYPYPEAHDRVRDRRMRRAERELSAFRRLSPGVERLHPLRAATPQECTEITAHVMQSLRFDTTYRIPSYLCWLERRGHEAAFHFHKRFLQHLQAQGDAVRRWVLKCPDHVFTLDAILATYPDARIVLVHRDPAAVLSSVAKLTLALRAPFTRLCDKHAIGAEVSHRWAEGARLILEAATSLPKTQVLNLHYDEVTAEPVRTVERLYRYFDLPFDQTVRARIESFVAREPRGGYAENRYDPSEFGLEPARIRESFEPYVRAIAELTPRAAAA
jgi:hypothetical protein